MGGGDFVIPVPGGLQSEGESCMMKNCPHAEANSNPKALSHYSRGQSFLLAAGRCLRYLEFLPGDHPTCSSNLSLEEQGLSDPAQLLVFLVIL